MRFVVIMCYIYHILFKLTAIKVQLDDVKCKTKKNLRDSANLGSISKSKSNGKLYSLK
jgi:hypothetical protein